MATLCVCVMGGLSFFFLGEEKEVSETKTILYIPLDNRPINTTNVAELNRISTHELVVLDSVLSLNKTEEKIQLIRQMIKEHSITDLVVSIDGLLYGGLLESRDIQKTSAIKPQDLISFKSLFRDIHKDGIHLYGFSTLQRLTTNVTSTQQLNDYQFFYQYNKKISRGFLGGYTLQDIEQSERTEKYFQNRKNKFDSNAYFAAEIIQYFEDFYFTQDDSQITGIQKIEQEQLEHILHQHSSRTSYIQNGADEFGHILLSKLAGTDSQQVYFYYMDDSKKFKEKILAYEGKNLLSLIKEKSTVFNITETKNVLEADFIIVLNGDGQKDEQSLHDFLKTAKGKPIGIVDFAHKKKEFQLAPFVLENIHEYPIVSYASWNTPSNTLGIVLAQMNSYINSNNHNKELMNEMYLKKRLTKDYFYKSFVQKEVELLLNEQKTELYELEDDQVSSLIEQKMNAYIQKETDWDERFSFETLPFKRLFEIEFALTTTPSR